MKLDFFIDLFVSECFKRKNIDGNAAGYGCHQNFYPNQRNEKESAVEHGGPHHADGYYFGMKRYGFAFHEITEIRAEQPLVEQPTVEAFGTAHIEGCRKQKKRRSGQERQKNSYYS